MSLLITDVRKHSFFSRFDLMGKRDSPLVFHHLEVSGHSNGADHPLSRVLFFPHCSEICIKPFLSHNLYDK